MDGELLGNVSVQWKETLRENFLKSIFGSPSEKQKAYIDVGYAYQCYAPASIYKYFPPLLNRLETVNEKKLWYSAPCKFNDVFDSDFPVDEDAVFKGIVKRVSGVNGLRIGSPMWKQIRAQKAQIMSSFKKSMDETRCTTGVVCFSESCDSLLMWSHYANNHQGFCVEYELLRFNTELKYTPVPVIYSDKRVRLSTINLDQTDSFAFNFLVEGLTSKSLEWSYESEWRIIRDQNACGSAWDKEKHGALLPSIEPSAIILGCAVSDELEKRVVDLCKTRRINVFKMEKDEKEYRLNKKPILQFDT